MTELSGSRARAIIERFDALTVLVVGDVMIDDFLVGRVDRISPEAPVPIVAFDTEEHRLGGAANVANNVGALGARAALVGAVGDDEPGRRLRSSLEAAGISGAGLVTVAERPTTRKLRIVASRHQVARVDFETDAELVGAPADTLGDHLNEAAARANIIVVSDYLKGVVTAGLMARTLAASRTHGVPLLVDPKVPHLDQYAGCTLLTPNHHEAATATHRAIRSDADARDAARDLRTALGCQSVVITRGEHGMWLLDGSGGTEATEEAALPAAAREVSDVTGAGDTVIATMALGLAAGATLTEAAQLANRAAGLAVARFGPATISADELLAACT
ncbi:MAG TPA: D-glycero-beta-D-manno-heptose-7-phosphate kinase [Acidobacteria bacterium]|jgi:D-beta-D-heptose 7-phosphate kinase/D-beta-D-heptose 1-phosphate adenosyltransferase|nr:D-glycero-beta-D-manno-heptose-7-phosphate kinase [Vicinamibacterales bacterium]HAK56454.1 D-glycero-beta-D-manno-heptose-7-phosphate kinase [Acidobacteriota bacterium]|tara:strand:- start:3937 stop:4935 length:999 start_codon:yes stop_codon:yes gene_type:complete